MVAIDSVSIYLAGFDGFIFGEAGWNRVGGRSFGKPGRIIRELFHKRERTADLRLCGKAENPLGMLIVLRCVEDVFDL